LPTIPDYPDYNYTLIIHKPIWRIRRKITLGQGGYIFCEWDSAKKEYPEYQKAFAELEGRVIDKCLKDWSPKTFSKGLTASGEQFGRTTILPALFRGFGQVTATPPVAGTNCLIHWRQYLTASGEQTLLLGRDPGNVLPKDFKVGWVGLMFPNKQQHITEFRWQISDGKYGRINVEEMHGYNKPAVIFEDGFLINEEASFDLHAYIDGPIPVDHEGNMGIYQRVIPLGAAYFKNIDRVLGAPGAVIT